MNIEVYALTNNEEKLMPYFMRHYNQFAKVILLESNSTDRTIEIAESMGADVWTYDVPDEVNDEWFLEVKNNCWKESKADWVMVVDADEFIYHPDIVGILEKTDATVFLPRLFNMFHDCFPTTEGQIYEEVTGGREGGGKMNIFRPSEITEINYAIGCHNATPEGNVNLSINSEIMTLHMRHLGSDYVIERNKRFASRMSELNRSMGWGFHVDSPPEEVIKYMHDEMTGLIHVI